MRSKLWILTKIFLKNGSEPLGKSKKKAVPKLLGIILIMALMMVSLGVPFGAFVGFGYKTLEPVGQQGAILALVLTLTSMVIFIFGIFYVLTTFYFSRDVEFLLPLPLNPYEIVGAKFITVVIYEYLTESVLLGPAIIVYGIKSGAGILFYLYSAIIFLSIPVIPLVLAAIINMIIMRFTNIGRHKDKLRVVGGVFALFVGIGINVFMQRSASSFENQEQLIQMLIYDKNSLTNIISRMFPSAKLASHALTESSSIIGIENLIIFLLITAAFIGVFLILAQGLYLKGVVGASEAYSKRKNLTGSELDKGLTQSSSVKSYLIKELRLLFRTPSYFINCVIMNFLWPVFLLIPALSQKGFVENLGKASTILNNSDVYGIVLSITFAMSVFVTATNGITSTSISREGQNIFVNKYLPMRYRDQLIAKLWSGVVLSAAGIGVVLVLASFVIKPPIYLIILMAVAAFLGIMFSALTGIFIDLKYPKLNWDNEQKAVKQNLNLMINMFFCVIVAGAFVFIVFKFGLTMFYSLLALVVVFGGLNIVLYYKLGTTGEKLFGKIEP